MLRPSSTEPPNEALLPTTLTPMVQALAGLPLPRWSPPPPLAARAPLGQE
jgi:hypothetical protein